MRGIGNGDWISKHLIRKIKNWSNTMGLRNWFRKEKPLREEVIKFRDSGVGRLIVEFNVSTVENFKDMQIFMNVKDTDERIDLGLFDILNEEAPTKENGEINLGDFDSPIEEIPQEKSKKINIKKGEILQDLERISKYGITDVVAVNLYDAADILGISPTQLSELRREGLGPDYANFGKYNLYPIKALRSYVENHMVSLEDAKKEKIIEEPDPVDIELDYKKSKDESMYSIIVDSYIDSSGKDVTVSKLCDLFGYNYSYAQSRYTYIMEVIRAFQGISTNLPQKSHNIVVRILNGFSMRNNSKSKRQYCIGMIHNVLSEMERSILKDSIKWNKDK